MKILVCFKTVPDLEMLSEEDWAVDSNLAVDVSFVKNILNCFDESALEMTLKLSEYSESFNESLTLTALTIGDKKAEMFLKTLYALKFQKAVRIENNEDVRFFPEVIAAVIAQYVEKINNQDVVVLGRQSGEGDNAKTPLLVAEMLGWPCITQVINIEPSQEERLRVTSMVEGGTLIQVIDTPCVLSVGNAPVSYLRVPTLKDKMSYGKRAIEVLNINVFNIASLLNKCYHEYQLIGLEKISNHRAGILIEGATTAEKAKKLYDHYLKERLEKQ